MLAEPDPDAVLAFPMRWRWTCSSGHVTTVGLDLGVGDDRTVEAIFADGQLVSLKDL